MNVTKLDINPELTQYRRPANYRQRVSQRRLGLVTDYIKSKPAGTPITYKEFGKMLQLSESAAYRVLSKFIDNGYISRYIPGLKSGGSTWAITSGPDVLTEPLDYRLSSPAPEPVKSSSTSSPLSCEGVESEMRQYVWEQHGQELQKFINWLNGSRESEQQ